MKIDLITNEQLLDDLYASEADIKICQLALACGVTKHKDGFSVKERLETNRKIIDSINQELLKRKGQNVIKQKSC